MQYDIEGRIRRQEQRVAKEAEPAPEEYWIGMRSYCENGSFPEGTHPKVKECTLKALATVQVIRKGLGISREPLIKRIPFPKEE